MGDIELNKSLYDVNLKITKARDSLSNAQTNLVMDRMNAMKIHEVKHCT